MFIYFLLLLTLIPIVELALLFQIAEAINWIPTIAIVVVTGVIGVSLAKREGIKTFARIQADLNEGKMPAAAMVEGVLILAAGLLLITPGVLTDLFGLFLLIPPCRRSVGVALSRSFRKRAVLTGESDLSDQVPEEPIDDAFIDVEVTGMHAESHPRRLDHPWQAEENGGDV